MHYHVKTNALICSIKGIGKTFRGIQSTSVATRNFVTLLLESSLLKTDISLVTISILQVFIQYQL